MATQRKSTTSPSGGQRRSTTTKKAGTSKSTARAPRSPARQGSDGDGGSRPATKKMSAMKVAQAAAQQLAQLTGREPECVIGIERSDEGWTVELEVVESRRIPDSTDILATYRAEVDEEGELMGYHRVERYVRGKSGRGDGGGR